MLKINFVGEKPLSQNHAGNKARLDVDSILRMRYGEPIANFSQIKFTSVWEKITYITNLSVINNLLKAVFSKNKYVVLQYPFYFNSVVKLILKKMIADNDIILIVHDVDTLRATSSNLINNDIEIMNKADVIILHNKVMIDFLKDNGITSKVLCLGIFDYLLERCPNNNFIYGNKIVFAGNLGKSDFLKLEEIESLGIGFNLYGPNFDKARIAWNNVTYKGSYGPDEVPYKLQGSFGLIWDGNAVDTCSGRYGEYMKYNNPHKLSLYIAAGLPVIVWKNAAIANFVEENNIGFTISSLFEIQDKIEQLSEGGYEEFKRNISALQKKVMEGYFTNSALVQCENILRNNKDIE